MFKKIKKWLIGKIIVKKVLGKLAKHATGAVMGLLLGEKIAPFVQPVLEAADITSGQVEAGMAVLLIGLFGAAWNYIEHRFIK